MREAIYKIFADDLTTFNVKRDMFSHSNVCAVIDKIAGQEVRYQDQIVNEEQDKLEEMQEMEQELERLEYLMPYSSDELPDWSGFDA